MIAFPEAMSQRELVALSIKMNQMQAVVYGVIALVFMAGGAAFGQNKTKPFCGDVLAEVALRKTYAKTVVAPVYPQEAIRSKSTGIAVAEICVPAGGGKAAARIVVAPNGAIAKAMLEALAQWTFGVKWRGNDQTHYVEYGGKITYYFVHMNEEWKVLSSTDSFYVGPRFAVSSTSLFRSSPAARPDGLNHENQRKEVNGGTNR